MAPMLWRARSAVTRSRYYISGELRAASMYRFVSSHPRIYLVTKLSDTALFADRTNYRNYYSPTGHMFTYRKYESRTRTSLVSPQHTKTIIDLPVVHISHRNSRIDHCVQVIFVRIVCTDSIRFWFGQIDDVWRTGISI